MREVTSQPAVCTDDHIQEVKWLFCKIRLHFGKITRQDFYEYTWDDSQMIKTSFTNTFTIAVERFYLYHPYFLILQEDYSTWGRLWGRGWANKVPGVQRYSSDLFYALTENFVSAPNKYLIKNLSTHQAAVQQSGAARRADVRSGKVRLRLHFMSYFNTR